MAQSKKNLLKKIDRQCAHLKPRVAVLAAQQRSDALIESFELIWAEAYEMLLELRRVHAGRLERSKYARPLVTSQQVARLYEQWQTFSQAVLTTL